MARALAHVCFVVSDLARSVRFYGGLGLEPAFYFTDGDGSRTGAYLRAGGRSFVELFVGQVRPNDERASYRHFCLEVDDIVGTVAALRAIGVEVGDAVLGADQSWQAWLADPDGNRIELHQYTDSSWQAPFLNEE